MNERMTTQPPTFRDWFEVAIAGLFALWLWWKVYELALLPLWEKLR